jgi:hypothetical protein
MGLKYSDPAIAIEILEDARAALDESYHYASRAWILIIGEVIATNPIAYPTVIAMLARFAFWFHADPGLFS